MLKEYLRWWLMFVFGAAFASLWWVCLVYDGLPESQGKLGVIWIPTIGASIVVAAFSFSLAVAVFQPDEE